MSKLNPTAKMQLTQSGFNEFQIQRIEQHTPLIEQINKFIEQGGKFRPTDTDGQEYGTFFDPTHAAQDKSGIRTGGEIAFMADKSNGYPDLTALAHELGHALGTRQLKSLDNYASAHDYAHADNIGEAEAIFNEYKILKWEQEHGKTILPPNPEMTGNMFAKIDSIMSQAGVSQEQKEQEVYDCLTHYNKYMIPGSFGKDAEHLRLTYYQNSIDYYLSSTADRFRSVTHNNTLRGDYTEMEQQGLTMPPLPHINTFISGMSDYKLYGTTGNDDIDAEKAAPVTRNPKTELL
ncbi:hypothetical protein [Conchiformibius kuhniae]|uniref:Uncharacterized protein n=1 Tax=Conchiformibius kuhniae TaxID=211502 RepID=A0A8T9MWV6_9NEIS|nr:hypothetical protein [Conchiformibius kuhniae]